MRVGVRGFQPAVVGGGDWGAVEFEGRGHDVVEEGVGLGGREEVEFDGLGFRRAERCRCCCGGVGIVGVLGWGVAAEGGVALDGDIGAAHPVLFCVGDVGCEVLWVEAVAHLRGFFFVVSSLRVLRWLGGGVLTWPTGTGTTVPLRPHSGTSCKRRTGSVVRGLALFFLVRMCWRGWRQPGQRVDGIARRVVGESGMVAVRALEVDMAEACEM